MVKPAGNLSLILPDNSFWITPSIRLKVKLLFFN
ncbi:methylthioribulose 1-phosphate dehydratase, partial [Nostoc sp. UCD122]|nr:methylthioribulose 1-phosphate dehydratase [Nostoc sp. UCD122]